ncbi:AMP-binding protein [Streptomyces olivoreticuli]|uniref:AMP-binding protein n=1 Tax=Streptomyces olivoreticuli TaxID=68246 RepID=UPI0030B84701
MNLRTLDRVSPADARPQPPASAGPPLPLTAAQAAMWSARPADTAGFLEIHGPVDPGLFVTALHRTVTEAEALRVRIVPTADGLRQLPVALEPLDGTAAGAHRPAEPPRAATAPRTAPVRGTSAPYPAPASQKATDRKATDASGASLRALPPSGVHRPLRLPFRVADLRDRRAPDASALAWMRGDLEEPLDLVEGPLFRHALLRVGERRWLWYQRAHHAVLDGYGHLLVARRVAEVYSALATGAEPGPGPFGPLAALVEEDAAYRASGLRARDRAHWLGEFADRPEVPTLAGRTAPPSRTPLRRTARLAPGTAERLRHLATSVRATWKDAAFAAQALYLARATRSDVVVLGLPVMGRTGSVALRVPGMAVNVLPLRLTVTPDTTFAELTHQVVTGIRVARRHQRLRHEDIRRDLGLTGRDRALAGPRVNIVPLSDGPAFAGARSDLHTLASGPVDDLTVHLHDRADGTGLRIDYEANPALYGQDALDAHHTRFLDLLTRLADSDPHRPLAGLDLATDAERDRIRAEFNDTAVAVPPTTLIGPFEARAARTPGAPALISAAGTLTYAELGTRANRLARHLRTLGVRPGALVAVALPHSPELVVALLAVLKAGGAYVPLDRPESGEGLVCVLTDRAGRAALPDARVPVLALDDPDLTAGLAAYLPTDPGRALTPQHPAYALPGAAPVPHATVDNRLRWTQSRYRLAPGDRVLCTGSSVPELFWPLREGATLVLAEPGAEGVARTIRQHRVTVAHFTPSALAAFLAEPGAAACTELRDVLSGGDALPRATADAFHRALPGTRLHQLYGQAVAHHTCEPGTTGPLPIGRPTWNTRLYVLDPAGRLCPPGVAGELYVAGERLATADTEPDPYGPPGARMYRAGVLARWRDDGSVDRVGPLR